MIIKSSLKVKIKIKSCDFLSNYVTFNYVLILTINVKSDGHNLLFSLLYKIKKVNHDYQIFILMTMIEM